MSKEKPLNRKKGAEEAGYKEGEREEDMTDVYQLTQEEEET